MKTLLIFLASTVAVAQIHDAPKPHADKVEWSLLAADASSRALDVYSTHQMLANGHHEILMPSAIADRPAAMASIETLDVIAVGFFAHRLENHGHRKLARLATSIDLAQDAPWAIRNMFLGVTKPALRPFPRGPIAPPSR